MSRAHGSQRLLPHDLTGAGAADEPFHAAVGEDDRAIPEVCRHRRAACDDGGHGEGLAALPERRDSVEEVRHTGLRAEG